MAIDKYGADEDYRRRIAYDRFAADRDNFGSGSPRLSSARSPAPLERPPLGVLHHYHDYRVAVDAAHGSVAPPQPAQKSTTSSWMDPVDDSSDQDSGVAYGHQTHVSSVATDGALRRHVMRSRDLHDGSSLVQGANKLGRDGASEAVVVQQNGIRVNREVQETWISDASTPSQPYVEGRRPDMFAGNHHQQLSTQPQAASRLIEGSPDSIAAKRQEFYRHQHSSHEVPRQVAPERTVLWVGGSDRPSPPVAVARPATTRRDFDGSPESIAAKRQQFYNERASYQTLHETAAEQTASRVDEPNRHQHPKSASSPLVGVVRELDGDSDMTVTQRRQFYQSSVASHGAAPNVDTKNRDAGTSSLVVRHPRSEQSRSPPLTPAADLNPTEVAQVVREQGIGRDNVMAQPRTEERAGYREEHRLQHHRLVPHRAESRGNQSQQIGSDVTGNDGYITVASDADDVKVVERVVRRYDDSTSATRRHERQDNHTKMGITEAGSAHRHPSDAATTRTRQDRREGPARALLDRRDAADSLVVSSASEDDISAVRSVRVSEITAASSKQTVGDDNNAARIPSVPLQPPQSATSSPALPLGEVSKPTNSNRKGGVGTDRETPKAAAVVATPIATAPTASEKTSDERRWTITNTTKPSASSSQRSRADTTSPPRSSTHTSSRSPPRRVVTTFPSRDAPHRRSSERELSATPKSEPRVYRTRAYVVQDTMMIDDDTHDGNSDERVAAGESQEKVVVFVPVDAKLPTPQFVAKVSSA